MDRAAALLDAHVAHTVAQLRGENFAALVEREVDYALSRAGEFTLEQVVARESVKDVAHKYVSTFALPGAIPEIVGDIVTRLRAHPANVTTAGEIVPREHAEAVADAVAQLPGIREWIAVQVTESPSVQAWLAEYLRTVTAGAVDANLRVARKVPGVSLGLSLGSKLAGGAVSAAAGAADQRGREMAEKAAATLLQRWRGDLLASLTDETVAEMLMGLWDQASDRQVRELLVAVRDDELVDLTSILYDLWLGLRTNDYLRSLIDTGVDYFFDTYGEFPLDELLGEFGLGRADLVEEAMRFAPPVIEVLADSGVLADLVRRQLAGFYESAEAQAILRAPLPR